MLTCSNFSVLSDLQEYSLGRMVNVGFSLFTFFADLLSMDEASSLLLLVKALEVSEYFY